jgi:hypothetical protein
MEGVHVGRGSGVKVECATTRTLDYFFDPMTGFLQRSIPDL